MSHNPINRRIGGGASDPPPSAPAAPHGLQPGAPVIGYVTQPLTRGDIERACRRAGWELVDIVRDQEEALILERPGLSVALERIAKGEAHGLVVNDARLLSRSKDFATFVQWFRDARAAFIALDLGLDTSTPEGARVAGALITLNGWAGAWINSRTRRSLAADLQLAKAASPRLSLNDRPEVLGRIARMAASGMSEEEIAEQLNDEGVPTLFGTEQWRPSSVQASLRYGRADRVRHSDDAVPAKGGQAADRGLGSP